MTLLPFANGVRQTKTAQYLTIANYLLAFLFLAGCSNPPLDPMKIGTGLWPGQEPLHLAKQLTLLPTTQFHLVEYPDTSSLVRALRNHSIDAAAINLNEVLTLNQYLDIAIILVLNHSTGGHVILSKPTIKEFHQLYGKTLAVEANTLSHYLLYRALTLHQMQPDDLHIKPITYLDQPTAFLHDQIDAIITYQPNQTQIMDVNTNELFSTREIHGEIYDVLAVRTSYLKQHQVRIESLVAAWYKVLRYIQTNNNKAVYYLAKRMKTTPGEVIKHYHSMDLCDLTCNQNLLDPDHHKLKQTLATLSKTLIHHNLINHTPNINIHYTHVHDNYFNHIYE